MSQESTPMAESIVDRVRERYADAALRVQSGSSCSCGDGCCGGPDDPVTANLYAEAETADLP